MNTQVLNALRHGAWLECIESSRDGEAREYWLVDPAQRRVDCVPEYSWDELKPLVECGVLVEQESGKRLVLNQR